MNDIITVTLTVELGENLYSSEPAEYSVATYGYSMLENCATEEYAELQTLLVDLFHYGSASQTYTTYKEENLVNAKLTEEQLAWGTDTLLALNDVFDKDYAVVDKPSVEWKGAGLKLENSITMRFKIEAESIENLVAKIVSASGQEWTIKSDSFEACDDGNGYYIYFNGLNASQMREAIYITIYEGTEIVSNTVCYSIESYAYAMQSSGDEALKSLLEMMMKYGDSAYAYTH